MITNIQIDRILEEVQSLYAYAENEREEELISKVEIGLYKLNLEINND